jgi:hypothetical protein
MVNQRIPIGLVQFGEIIETIRAPNITSGDAAPLSLA